MFTIYLTYNKITLKISHIYSHQNCLTVHILLVFIKNVSSFISHKKTLGLRDYGDMGFKHFLFSIFFYELILIKNSMIANIMKTQFFK